MCEKYSGWTNRETWAFMLHVNNDQYLQEEVMRLATEQDERYEIAIAVEAWWQELKDTMLENPTRESLMMILDIGSDYRIDWRDIAESLYEDTQDERKARLAGGESEDEEEE